MSLLLQVNNDDINSRTSRRGARTEEERLRRTVENPRLLPSSDVVSRLVDFVRDPGAILGARIDGLKDTPKLDRSRQRKEVAYDALKNVRGSSMVDDAMSPLFLSFSWKPG